MEIPEHGPRNRWLFLLKVFWENGVREWQQANLYQEWLQPKPHFPSPAQNAPERASSGHQTQQLPLPSELEGALKSSPSLLPPSLLSTLYLHITVPAAQMPSPLCLNEIPPTPQNLVQTLLFLNVSLARPALKSLASFELQQCLLSLGPHCISLLFMPVSYFLAWW